MKIASQVHAGHDYGLPPELNVLLAFDNGFARYFVARVLLAVSIVWLANKMGSRTVSMYSPLAALLVERRWVGAGRDVMVMSPASVARPRVETWKLKIGKGSCC